MASVDMCKHDWPGSGCVKCRDERNEATIARLTAELAEAREKLGLAYETAAQVCVEGAARRRKQAQTLVGSGIGLQYARWSAAALALEIAADDISALDPDATAARDTLIKRVREDETRACAAIASGKARYTREAIKAATAEALVTNLVTVTEARTAHAIEDAINARLNQPKEGSGK